MARETTVEEILQRSHRDSLAELRKRIEEFPIQDQQGIENCAQQLRRVLAGHTAFADIALLVVHYEYMARMEALFNPNVMPTPTLYS
jgi:hypothetical protein